MILPPKLAIVDLETTGANFLLDRIIEVGILRVENDQLVDTYQSLVNPLCSVPPEIVCFTGINPAELETAPTFDQLRSEIWDLLSDCVFVAHNARFDYSFLRSEFRRLDHNFSAKSLCTVKLSRALFPQHRHHNLSTLIERFGINCVHRHRALGDAQAVWDFLQHLLKTFSPDTLSQAIKTVFKRPTKPIQLSEAVLDSLPESPGVYIFYGDKTRDSSGVTLGSPEVAINRLPLYIGKSLDIRSRVFDHFSDSISSPRKLQLYQQVKDIDFVETAGELGALLLESKLIKKLRPLYNRQLRDHQQLTILSPEFKLKKVDHLDYDTAVNCWGIFKNSRKPKKILQEVDAQCWLNGCKGGDMHNLHLQIAFAHLKIKKWPFSGPIAIPEENIFNHQTAVHIFHLWSHLSTYDSLDEFRNQIQSDLAFDVDTYHILRRYLKSPRPRLFPV